MYLVYTVFFIIKKEIENELAIEYKKGKMYFLFYSFFKYFYKSQFLF